MECEVCDRTIEEGEEREYLGRNVCEDCYIDASMNMKTCDPWAVRNAKSTERMMGGQPVLTSLQSRILEILEKTGGLEAPELLERLEEDLSLKELEMQFSILRHMEKARAEKRGDRIVLRLW